MKMLIAVLAFLVLAACCQKGEAATLKPMKKGVNCETKAALAVKVYYAQGDLERYRDQWQTGSLSLEKYSTMVDIQDNFGAWPPMSDEEAREQALYACQKGKL